MFPAPVPVGESLEAADLSGLLGIDRTRGKYHQFTISDPRAPHIVHQLAFPDNRFTRGPLRTRCLDDKGRALWKRLWLLAGKGVTVHGIWFPDQVQMDRGGRYEPRMRILVEEVKECPACDPKPPKMAPKPTLPKECVEEDAEAVAAALEKMTDKQRIAFQARQRYNEQLATWYKDEDVEQLMLREAI